MTTDPLSCSDDVLPHAIQSITNTLAILNTNAPFHGATAKDSLDIALIFGSYEQSPSLFFLGDGVWQLVETLTPTVLQVKDFSKTFAALPFYDIENIFVCEDSLTERNLPHTFNISTVTVLAKADFIHALNAHKIILRY